MITSATLPKTTGRVKAATRIRRGRDDGASGDRDRGAAGPAAAPAADACRRRVRGDQDDADGPRHPAWRPDLDRRAGTGVPGVVDTGAGGAGTAGVGGARGQGAAEGV